DIIEFSSGLKYGRAGRADLEKAQTRDRSDSVDGGAAATTAIARNASALMAEAKRRGLPVISASLRPEPADVEALRGQKIVAFAGIGRPSKFFASLRSIGAELVAERGFPDHHPFGASELDALAFEARAKGAVLATTEKDLMRIGDSTGGGPTGGAN